MNRVDSAELRGLARQILIALWQEKGKPCNAGAMIPVATEVIIRSILRVNLEEPEEIPSEQRGYEIAAYMERTQNRIVVAQKYRPEWRRFTMAHEVAHWVIHPGISYHRDRPLTGAEQANSGRPVEEREADIFASELVMPTRLVTEHFEQVFIRPIDGRTPDYELAERLSSPERKINEIDLSANLRFRSMAVAVASSYGPGMVFVPLARRFGVSPTAMAIKLEELGLVI